MDNTRTPHCTMLVIVLLAFCQLANSATVSPVPTTASSTTPQSPTTTTTTTDAPTSTTTESLQDIINRAVNEAVAKALKDLMAANAVTPTTTPTPSGSTTTAGTTTNAQTTTNKSPDTTTVSSAATPTSSGTTTVSSAATSASSATTTISSATTTASGATTTASSATTTDSIATTTESGTTIIAGAAPRQASCPDGIYDSQSKSVSFFMEECEITVYLAKGPKGPKGRKGGRKSKPKSGMEKSVVATPRFGTDIDNCPTLSVQNHGKDIYWIEAGECFMFVAKAKGKGKKKNAAPTIISRPL